MNNLEQYLAGEYRERKDEITKIEQKIIELFKLFKTTCDCSDFIEKTTDRPQWPYRIKNEKDDKQQNYSESTTAMILHSLLGFLEDKHGKNNLKSTIGKNPFIEKIAGKLFASERIELNSSSENEDKGFSIWPVQLEIKLKNIVTFSKTYGCNDPFTYFWMISTADSLEKEDVLKELMTRFKTKVEDGFKHDEGSGLDLKYQGKIDLSDNALILSTIMRSGSLANIVCAGNKKKDIFDELENRLHRHLSYRNIPDSRFDPSELAFCLEGMLCYEEGHRVGEELAERVFDVLVSTLETNTVFWKPVTPIYAKNTGHILLPLGVEVVNSLLRVCKKLDERDGSSSFFSKYRKLFRRYVKWLLAQECKVQRKVDGKVESFSGWNSEHIGHDKEIHLWQTSQIFIFLFTYNTMLKKHVARITLDSAGFKLKKDHLKVNPGDNETPKEKWIKVVNGEPVSTVEECKVFSEINKLYVQPRVPWREVDANTSNKMHYSMLLYGPPGTGKTRLAVEIARALEWDYLIITPSDFLAGGSAEVEMRAKSIFTMLEEQEDIVVLFDEIDHFLLDRSSKEYASQTGIFQFMTPGMLPKLHDLRDKKKVIFIIATNYGERIDSAIKRPGRVDDRFLLLPPDKERRGRNFESLIKLELLKLCSVDTTLPKVDDEYQFSLEEKDRTSLAEASCFFTYKEIEDCIKATLRKVTCDPKIIDKKIKIDNLPEIIEQTAKEAKGLKATITPDSYETRFFISNENYKSELNSTPYRDYLALLSIRKEIGVLLKEEETSLMNLIKQYTKNKLLTEKQKELFKDEVKKCENDNEKDSK